MERGALSFSREEGGRDLGLAMVGEVLETVARVDRALTR